MNFNTIKTENWSPNLYKSGLKALLMTSAALPIMTAAVHAQDTEEAARSADEVIVVTGIRGSMRAAADLKRNDSRIVDAIVAEDIGKLPDNNLAEALQRITGVSINTDFGVGDSVSIRGLSENRVELNGRSTMGDDRDGVSLQDFPSSFLRTVEVIKSPTADMIEGALGGTIRMNTIRPIELRKLTIAGSFDVEYADKTQHKAPIGNLAIGNVWEFNSGAKFGVMGSLSYQDRSIRQDEYQDRVRLYDEDVNGLTANTPSGRFAVREQHTVQQFVEDRERLAGNLTFQYAPASGRGNFYADLNFTERNGSQAGSSILDVGGSRVYNENTTQDEFGQVNNYTLAGAFVIPKTWSEFRNTDSYSHAFGADWDFTDKLTVSGEFATSSSKSYEPDSEFNLRPINHTNWDIWADQYTPGVSNFNDDRVAFGLRHTTDAIFIQDGDRIPSIVYSDGQALLSPENLAIRRFQHDDRRTENTEDAFRIDFEYDDPFDGSFVSSVKIGGRYAKNDYEFNHSRYLASNLYRDVLYDEGLATERPFALWIDEYEAMFPGSFETVNHNNSFNQAGLSGRNDLLNYTILDGDLLADPNATFGQVQQMLEGTNFATTGSLQDNLAVQEGSFRDITEKTKAFYASVDLDFGRLRAVVGGRYIETDLNSTVYSNGSTVNGNHDYSDFLPSLNASYELTDDTIVRFAAAKVMRRPNYSELSPAFEIDGAYVTAEQGAIDLAPFRATQFDVSVEHYFGDGGLISAAFFYKDVESFLSSATTCSALSSTVTNQNVTEWENVCLLDSAGVDNMNLVFSTLGDFGGSDADGFAFTAAQRDAGLTGIRTSRVTNGEKGKIKGFELGYQQQFTFLPGFWSGFGVNTNYTYADSEQPNGNPLLNISKHTLNTQLYWENEKFQVRFAYNYRSDYLFTEEETRVANVGARALNSATNDMTSADYDPTAGNNYRDSRGQLDFSTSYNINDNFTVTATATNLTGTPSVFKTELGSPWRYTEADRRFSIGMRVKY